MRRLGLLSTILLVAACSSNLPVRTKAIAIGTTPAKTAGPTLSSLGDATPTPTAATPTPGATSKPTGSPSPSATPTPHPSTTTSSSDGVGGVVYHDQGPQATPAPATPTPVPLPGSASGISTLAGDGASGYVDASALASEFVEPVALAAQGTTALFVGDRAGNRVRRIDLASYQVTTVAGTGTAGYLNGAGPLAQFKTLNGLAVDAQGNLYVADTGNHCIRKIDMSNPASPTVSLLAGSVGSSGLQNGAGVQAKFNGPLGLVLVGRTLVVADGGNHCVRTVDIDAATVSTLAGTGVSGNLDGAGSAAKFTTPTGVAADASGNVFVADAGAHNVRRVAWSDPAHGVTTIAGRGTLGFIDADGTSAAFNAPGGIAVATDGTLYLADTSNNLLRKVDMSAPAHTVSTWAGIGIAGFQDGPATSARFSGPVGMAWASGGLCVADPGNFRIRVAR